VDTIFLAPFSFLFMCFGFTLVTWFWWKISRRFFIFLAYFSESKIKLKNSSWKKIAFNYGVFGPLGLLSISGYLYTLLIFFKFF